MKIFRGKIISGKMHLRPSMFCFGGCLFIIWFKFSYMIVLPDWLIYEASLWGIDLIGD